MQKSHRRAWEELARCINQLILKEPFYGHLLGSVIRVHALKFETCAELFFRKYTST